MLGVSGTNLQIQVGQGTMGLALASIKEVRMAVPPEVAQAIKAFQERDYKKVQVLLKSLEKWKGLPPEWAQGVTAMFGDVQAELGDMVKAEAAYKEFQRLYPSAQGSAQAEVGMARLAVGRKEFATAKAKLDPVATKALGEKNFNRELGRAYSQTFYLLGQIAESEGKNEEALEHYLRTVTLFYHDAPTVALAQEKADALRAQKVTVP